MPAEWQTAVLEECERVEGVPYELWVLRSLRPPSGAGRSGSQWRAAGANRGRVARRSRVKWKLHYVVLRQPLDSTTFIDGLRGRVEQSFDQLREAVRAGP